MSPRTTDPFALVLGVRRGPRLFGASTGVSPADAPAGERYAVFAIAVAASAISRWRVGDWCESYALALAAYESMKGTNYGGHRLARRHAGRRVYENVNLCVRSESDPAFTEAPRVEDACIRAVCGGSARGGRGRGLRTRDGAARAYARRLGLNGNGGFFRATDANGHRVGPVIAQGLVQLAEVADTHERGGGIFYSVPVVSPVEPVGPAPA